MSIPHDALDPTVVTPESAETGEFQYSLVDLVANGRVFILNNRGEMERVELFTYWKGDDILSVCDSGYEFNEDGKITRAWNGSQQPGKFVGES